MFASNVDDLPPEDEDIVRMKVQSKIDSRYAGIGELPGVLVD